MRSLFESVAYEASGLLASGLLSPYGMKIDVRAQEPEPADRESRSRGTFEAIEVLEGGDEFLEAIQMRLNEIIRKPNGRFVISYVSGQPGSKVPPTVQ